MASSPRHVSDVRPVVYSGDAVYITGDVALAGAVLGGVLGVVPTELHGGDSEALPGDMHL